MISYNDINQLINVLNKIVEVDMNGSVDAMKDSWIIFLMFGLF